MVWGNSGQCQYPDLGEKSKERVNRAGTNVSSTGPDVMNSDQLSWKISLGKIGLDI